jgi:hypothetical protein
MQDVIDDEAVETSIDYSVWRSADSKPRRTAPAIA